MRTEGELNKNKILNMIPLSVYEIHDGTDEEITEIFTDDTIQELTKLGEILKGISTRQRMNGYCIIGAGIFNSHNELIYEKEQSIQTN